MIFTGKDGSPLYVIAGVGNRRYRHSMNNNRTYYVYRGTTDRTLRLAIMPGYGLAA